MGGAFGSLHFVAMSQAYTYRLGECINMSAQRHVRAVAGKKKSLFQGQS